jgi:hypothetical protein
MIKLTTDGDLRTPDDTYFDPVAALLHHLEAQMNLIVDDAAAALVDYGQADEDIVADEETVRLGLEQALGRLRDAVNQ